MKRPVKIMLILLGAVALGVLVLVANVSRARSAVRGVEVNIRYGKTPVLVDEQTVRDSILSALPALLQHSVGGVDREAVAAAASRVPYLSDVSASVSPSGMVVVRAKQRNPIVRLYYGGREFYLDAEGCLMPASILGSCPVVVAGGDFRQPLPADSLWQVAATGAGNAQLTDLWRVACYLNGESKYGDLIDQLYVERDGDLLMVPKLGNHVVELGDAADLDTKFANLLAFYREGMPRAGWDTYSRISLKYRGQVVCTKRNETK